ncbi:non-canonical poly(A) RNA polymerase PAPD5/7, partial [Phenoliferia sp. Uapishka_3]
MALPGSLPPKPSSSSTPSSSRKSHRKRSESPAAEPSGSTSTPTKKGNYVRRADAPAGENLLSKALHNVQNQKTISTPVARSSAEAPATPSSTAAATPSSARAQFEQQEDFISFGDDFDDEDKPSPRNASGGRGGSGTKRRRDDFDDEKRDEGTKRLAKRERERSTPWCDTPGVNWALCDNAIAMLNAEARAFITYISPTPIEHELRLWTIELIRRTIKSRWSDADVECFGSVGTGLYLPGGDIDLVVLCPTFPSPPLKPTSSLLHHLASLLLTSHLAEPSSLLVIAKARVPIVKFVTRYGGFSVDLSVNQKGGVDAAVRVRNLLEEHASRDETWVEPGATKKKGKGKEKGKEKDPEVALVDYGVARSLVMLVKAFLNQRGMNEVFTGGLGSYSIICLVVSFLQLHPKIQAGEIHPSRNIGLLFVEFLEYYGKHFNFNEAGITLRGRGGYFNKHDKGWFRPNQPYLLSIEDPNDPSNDVSGGSHNIVRVRQTLAGAFDVLTATLLHRVSHFEASRNPNIEPLSGSSLPNADVDAPSPLCQSILGSVIGMARASIQSRERNIDLYNDGILQALIARSDQSLGAGTSKKALQRARKEAKEADQRDRTIARLGMRQDEREKKQARKELKKRELEESLAPMADAPKPKVDKEPSVARKLFQEAEDSRYSIASGSTSIKGAAAKAKNAVFVHDSEEDDSSDSHDDGDVEMGGGHGDTLVGSSKKPEADDFVSFGDKISFDDSQDEEDDDKGESEGGSKEDDSSDGSGDLVVRNLVPRKALTAEETAKKQAKASYWASKGAVSRESD